MNSGKYSLQERMSKLVEQVHSSSTTIGNLKESIDRIEKLITVVRGITAKTDLLALNASIEAARAGHSGKGFAVVAHEVARLAEKSQESIQNVDLVFAELREGIMTIAAQVKDSSNNIQELRTALSHHEQSHEQNRNKTTPSSGHAA